MSNIPLGQEGDGELGRAGAAVPSTPPSKPTGIFPASRQQLSSSSAPSNPHCVRQAPALRSLSPPLPVPCAPPGQVSACSRPTRALHTSAANSSCPFARCSLPTSFFKGPRFQATSFLTQEGETIWRELRGGGPDQELEILASHR